MTEKRADIMTDPHLNPEDSFFESYPLWLKERLNRFRDMKFGLFIHWGIYSQWSCIESWPLVEEDTWARPDGLKCWEERGRDIELFRKDYWNLNTTFNPQSFSPEKWAELAESAGMKYVCFTTKHHDGFCMFDTATTDYRITHSTCPFHTHPHANITKAVFDAFREKNLAISCYFSKSDWHCPWYWLPQRPAPDRNPNYNTRDEPEIWTNFVNFVHEQVRELMSDYGPIDVLWLDGGQVRPPHQDIRMDELVEMARALQPGLIVADRTVGGPHENIITPEQEVPEKPIVVPWESCITMGDGWSFKPNDTYKPASDLIELLVDVVAKGGNLLLNVGPSPEGTIPPEAAKRLKEIGKWMDVNGEAIYGTNPFPPYCENNIRYTAGEDRIYAVILQKDEDTIPSKNITLKGISPDKVAGINMLGYNREISFSRSDGAVQVKMPHVAPPGGYAWVLCIKYK